MIQIGNVWTHHVADGQLLLKTEAAQMRIQLHGDDTIRVQACQLHESFQESTYACPGLPADQPFEVAESDKELRLETSKVRLVIGLNPLRLRFETPDGVVLSEDDPGLGIIWDGSEVTNYKVLQSGERFLGLGEKTGPLDKAGKQFRNWNTDAFGYNPSTDPLYVSCPFYMGISHERPYGIFLNNHSETTFNFGAANDRFSFYQAASGVLDYCFFAGPEPADILRSYTALTGRMELPPLWSIGFQQCRYSYYPAAEILRVATTFRELHIPADVIYFDIHYMQDFKVFTWHGTHFPDPESLIRELRAMGFRVVIILDPGVKVEEGYHIYDEGVKGDYFVKYPDGVPYSGAAWPGWCHFPDFTKEEVRQWWSGKVEEMAALGVDGFWNDMNEPAVWGHATPNVVQFALEGKGGSHKEAHNVYGMQMARATADGARTALNGERPFVLTRATFSGGQRDSAVWTGDNFANDEHLLLGARMVSGMGLSGFPFTGNDVGGFTGDASAGLYRRWIACSAFQPLMRAHTMINSKHAEPWSFGEETTEVARNYIGLRYQLLPHLYSLFYEASINGMPPARSLVFRFHREWKVFSKEFQNQFLLGDHLMVCPVGGEETLAKVYLPEGRWYHFFNDRVYEGGQVHLIEMQRDTLPVFVQAGGLLPMQNLVSHTAEETDGVLRLHAYTGAEGTYGLYGDDGITRVQQGWTCRMHMGLNTLTINAPTGDLATLKFAKLKVYLHGCEADEVLVNGSVQNLSRQSFRFMPAISNFDPYDTYPDGEKRIDSLASIEVNFPSEHLEIKWK